MTANRIFVGTLCALAFGHAALAGSTDGGTAPVQFGVQLVGHLSASTEGGTRMAQKTVPAFSPVESASWIADETSSYKSATAKASTQQAVTMGALSIGIQESNLGGVSQYLSATSGQGILGFGDTITMPGQVTDTKNPKWVKLHMELRLKNVEFNSNHFSMYSGVSLTGLVSTPTGTLHGDLQAGGVGALFSFCNSIDPWNFCNGTSVKSSSTAQSFMADGDFNVVAGSTLHLVLTGGAVVIFGDDVGAGKGSVNLVSLVCLKPVTEGVTLQSASGFDYAGNC